MIWGKGHTHDRMSSQIWAQCCHWGRLRDAPGELCFQRFQQEEPGRWEAFRTEDPQKLNAGSGPNRSATASDDTVKGVAHTSLQLSLPAPSALTPALHRLRGLRQMGPPGRRATTSPRHSPGHPDPPVSPETRHPDAPSSTLPGSNALLVFSALDATEAGFSVPAPQGPVQVGTRGSPPHFPPRLPSPLSPPQLLEQVHGERERVRRMVSRSQSPTDHSLMTQERSCLCRGVRQCPRPSPTILSLVQTGKNDTASLLT